MKEGIANESIYPSVEDAKRLLSERFGDGLTFEVNLERQSQGYGYVYAERHGVRVGRAHMGLDPASNSSQFWRNNSGKYRWFIKDVE